MQSPQGDGCGGGDRRRTRKTEAGAPRLRVSRHRGRQYLATRATPAADAASGEARVCQSRLPGGTLAWLASRSWGGAKPGQHRPATVAGEGRRGRGTATTDRRVGRGSQPRLAAHPLARRRACARPRPPTRRRRATPHTNRGATPPSRRATSLPRVTRHHKWVEGPRKRGGGPWAGGWGRWRGWLRLGHPRARGGRRQPSVPGRPSQ